MLEIKIATNERLKDLVFAPNTVVLAKQTFSSNPKTGEVTNRIKYIQVCSVENTEPQTIIKNLLKYCLSEFWVRNEFTGLFSEANIRQGSIFNEFLTGKEIYRTNSEGKISSVLVSDVPLSKTALRLNTRHEVVICASKNRSAAIHTHSKAILMQFRILRSITEGVQKLEKELSATAEKTKTKAKAKTGKATPRTAPTSTTISAVPTAPAIAAAPAGM